VAVGQNDLTALQLPELQLDHQMLGDAEMDRPGVYERLDIDRLEI
jgi:hypothetical protein